VALKRDGHLLGAITGGSLHGIERGRLGEDQPPAALDSGI
jgi:hypothetical protein